MFYLLLLTSEELEALEFHILDSAPGALEISWLRDATTLALPKLRQVPDRAFRPEL